MCRKYLTIDRLNSESLSALEFFVNTAAGTNGVSVTNNVSLAFSQITIVYSISSTWPG